MTRFEAYLNTWSAVCYASSRDSDDADLATLAQDMDPFWFGSEDSRDIYIYQRYSDLWLSEGTTYTPAGDDFGFTFARKFFTLLPKTDSRFVAGARAMEATTQSDWEYLSAYNARNGTFMLLYYMLKKALDRVPTISDILEGMDPFNPAEGALCSSVEISERFISLWSVENPPLEISYSLASRFVDGFNRKDLVRAFRLFSRFDWDEIRAKEPLAFRTLPVED